jgi:hypothetical protein
VPRLAKPLYVAAALLVIAALTLLPAHGPAPDAFACVFCGDRAVSDALTNIILFVPLGVGLAAMGMAPPRAFIAAALLSGGIELAQLWIPGRDSSLGDVLSNTLGGWTGAWAFALAGRWLHPAPRLARLLAGFWTAGATATVFATMLLLRPSYPPSVYYGQWTANLGGDLEWYRGTVLSAHVGDLAVPIGRAADSRRLQRALEAESPMVVQAIAGPRVPGLAPLFSIYDDRQREVVLIGPDRDDLVLRYRTRGFALGLDAPDFRARGLLRGIRPGDSLSVVATQVDGDLCLSLNARRVCGLSPGPEGGWSLLYFVGHFPGWLVAILNVAWLALLAAPIGFWSPDRRTRVTLGGVLLLVVVGASVRWAGGSGWDGGLVALGLMLGAAMRMKVKTADGR